MKLFSRYFQLFRAHWPEMLLSAGLAALASILASIAVRLFTDAMTVLAGDATTRTFPTEIRLLQLNRVFSGFVFTLRDAKSALTMIAGVMSALAGAIFLKGILTYAHTYLVNRVTYRVMTETRNALHAKILSFPLATMNAQRTGDLMSRSVDDVNLLIQAVYSFGGAIRGCAMIGVYLGFMLLQSWTLTLGTLLFFPALALLIQRFGSRIRATSARLQKELGDVATTLQEGIFGLKVVKAFGAEAEQRERFERQTQAMYRTAMRRVRVFALQSPVTEFVMALGLAGVFGLGCWEALRGTLSFGALLAHMSLAAMMVEPVKSIGALNSLIYQGFASIERIDDVFRLPSEAMDSGEPLTTLRGEVEFQDVSFAYESEPVLKDISCRVEAGQTVALVGRSGAGKTTLLHLIARFYEPTSGQLLMDGIPSHRISLASLRSHMGMVPQETLLFAGTVADNIRLAHPSATDMQVEEAARRAYAHEFIIALPDGYQTLMGERGVRLSGGQQQRIAIARAFLKDPRIFLLDEATAALDSESEATIQKSFDDLLKDRTAFVIAHRLSTILNADLILVLDEGKLVEAGTHAELLARNGLYARLHETQFHQKASSTASIGERDAG